MCILWHVFVFCACLCLFVLLSRWWRFVVGLSVRVLVVAVVV